MKHFWKGEMKNLCRNLQICHEIELSALTSTSGGTLTCTELNNSKALVREDTRPESVRHFNVLQANHTGHFRLLLAGTDMNPFVCLFMLVQVLLYLKCQMFENVYKHCNSCEKK